MPNDNNKKTENAMSGGGEWPQRRFLGTEGNYPGLKDWRPSKAAQVRMRDDRSPTYASQTMRYLGK